MIAPIPLFPLESQDELSRRPLTRIAAYSLERQQAHLNMTKRDKWTERDLIELPTEESDVFERKSGRLFESGKETFSNTLAKAVSAFANSGGGSIVIGVSDDGKFDGLPPAVGRATMRDWIEMTIPLLVDYPLSDFRVHTVEKCKESKIPEGREIIVIEIGDSAVAPHQSKKDKIYYRREGGRSVPAPHFYLELLRQRLTNPKLGVTLCQIAFYNAYETASKSSLFVILDLKFHLTNVGRVVASLWQLKVSQVGWDSESDFDRGDDIFFSDFPKPKTPKEKLGTVRVGSRAILPGCLYMETKKIGLQLRPRLRTTDEVAKELEALILPVSLGCQVATETSPGEIVWLELGPSYERESINAAIADCCPDFFTGLPL